LTPGFGDKLRSVVAVAIDHFFAENTQYSDPSVVSFLLDPHVSQDIGEFLLDSKPIDIDSLRSQLADSLDVPKGSGPWEWPHGLDVDAMMKALVLHIAKSLFEQADPALSLLATRISNLESTLSAVALEVVELKRDFPRIFENASAESQTEEVRQFEKHFLEHMGARFGRLTTPGARDLHGVKQTLSVAYISLNVRAHGNAEPVRAEQFLRENPCIVVRGPAGSGKTTLLSFVIWCCTRDAVNGSGWTGGIPIFIPLRTVARTEQGAPAVDRFVSYSVDQDNWSLETPKNWVNDVLREKRALVMLDGVDELPASRRAAFWEWLAHFSEEYPGNRIIVTSRVLPGTTGESGPIKTDQWNVPDDFVQAQLEEMSDGDVARFIEHWHDAVDTAKLEPADKAELTQAKERLPGRLADPTNKRIRELCSTPLLCAMVCVLHWREEGYLPRQRVELYDRCCEMLIEARDLKRLITAPPGPLAKMTKNDKERVLQRLAFEMMDNQPEIGDESDKVTYRIEIPRSKAIKWIVPWIAGFQVPEARSASAEDVLDFLVERTGLLREPAGGLIDFPHRTFQEYLAACAAGAEGREGLLANKADDDQWHETIMLAAGTTTGGVRFGHDLIEALLRRAERHRSMKPRSQRIRKTCFALALGALENLRQPDPALRDRVLARVDELVPPNDESGARVLAVAGDAAVPHLQYVRWKDERTTTVAACAQALRLIGTSQARRAIEEGYISDRRDPVIAEVCRTDEVSFADIPLIAEHVSKKHQLPRFVSVANCHVLVGLNDLEILSLDGASIRNLDSVSYLSSLKTILVAEIPTSELARVDWPKSIEEVYVRECSGSNFDWLLGLPELRKLTLTSCGDERTLSILGSLERLSSLVLVAVPILDPTPLQTHGHLKSLVVVDCKSVNPRWPLVSLASLETIVIDNSEVRELDDLSQMQGLKEVELSGVDVPTLEFLTPHIGLETVRLQALRTLTNIDALSGLGVKTLFLADLPALRKINRMEALADLRSLTIVQCAIGGLPDKMPAALETVTFRGLGIRNVESLREARNLKSIEIDDCGRVSDLSPLGPLLSLEELHIEDMPRLDELGFLGSLSSLRRMSLVGCSSIETLSGAEGLASLEDLTLINCQELADISALSKLPNLKAVTLLGVPKVRDLAPFVESNSLSRLVIRQQDPLENKIPESVLSKVVKSPHVHLYRGSYRNLYVPKSMSYRFRYRQPSWRIHYPSYVMEYERIIAEL